jgi:superfamily II DNA or RNA helicase
MPNYASRNNAFYTPLTSLSGSIPPLAFEKLLILKSGKEIPVEFSAESLPKERRSIVKRTVRQALPDGLYVFKSVGVFEGLLVLGAKPELSMEIERDLNTTIPDESPLYRARDWIEDFWHEAESPVGKNDFSVGSWAWVQGTGSFGMVIEVEDGLESPLITLEIEGQRKDIRSSALVKLPGDPRSPKTWMLSEPCDYTGVTNMVTWAKLNHALSDTLYSFAATRTVFRPYQFLPALKILNSERGRLLVADEVGLGKTIEAGLIWAELDQRHELKRVLIVAPASLSLKWKQEMRRRFMRDVQIWKIKDLDQFLDRYEESSEVRCAAIISLETFRTAQKQRKRLDELSVGFDLVILDEAHSVRNKNSKGFDLADLLSYLSEYLVFLSATPLNLGKDDFFNLMHLLEPDLFQDKDIFIDQIEPNKYLNDTARFFMANRITEAREALSKIPNLLYGQVLAERPSFHELTRILDSTSTADAVTRSRVRELCLALNTTASSFTRTRKKDVPDKQAVREPREIEVNWTKAERAFYEVVHEHFYEKAKASGLPPAFIMQMPLRQTCSSIPVMQEQLRRRGLGYLTRGFDSYVYDDLPELEAEAIPSDQEESEELLVAGIGSLVVSSDSKLAALQKELRLLKSHTGSKQALIFTFFRGTVEYLQRELSSEYRVGALHGGIKPEDRDQVIQDFREEKFDIVVANQVGSEGLDFQFCNVLVNYDLPWNPMQVEQRIGRLDRFGQTSEKIHILNMKVPDTIESDIFLRLYNRIGIFEESIGDLEPILQDAMEDLTPDWFDPNLTSAQRESQIVAKSLAIENERKNRELLEKEGNLLISGSVEIEGLTEAGPSHGKYIGEGELFALVKNLVDQHGGQVLPMEGHKGFYGIIGSSNLAGKLALLNSSDAGSSLGSLLSQKLRDRELFTVTFNSQHLQGSSLADAEIISARHPLVRLAVSQENDVTLLPRRFGRCQIRVPGLAGKYIAHVSLAESDGVAPKRELWVTAIDSTNGERQVGLESALLEAIASGRLEASERVDTDLEMQLKALIKIVNERQRAAEISRQQENRAQVLARRQSELQLNQRKMDRLTRMIDEGSGIESINRPRLARAADERVKIEAKFTAAEDLHLSLQPVALVLVDVT